VPGIIIRVRATETAVAAGEATTWDRIVELAQQRLQVAGYSGLHYGAIATELKISRAAVHHYFPNKVDLARAVINGYYERTRAQLDLIAASLDGPEDRLRDYVGLYREIIAHGDRRLCPGGMLAAEAMTLPIELAEDVRAFFEMHIDWIAEQFYSDLSPERAYQTAGHAVASLQGALLVGRVLSQPTFVDAAADEIARTLGRPTVS
jgi:TetR/AcrR family transcriptional regulator, transcriptional repressor for nem operon